MHRVLDSRATDTVEYTRGNFNQDTSRTSVRMAVMMAVVGEVIEWKAL